MSREPMKELLRDPEAYASRLANTWLDDASDWGPPRDVTAMRPPIRLGVGMPDPEALPREALTKALDRALRASGDAPFRYHFGAGFEPLREALAERAARQTGLALDRDWLRLTNGSSGGIDLIARCLLDPGDVVLVESPSYMGTLHNFRCAAAEIRAVPMDAEGLRADALDRALDEVSREGKRAKLVYTISGFQNPTGVSLGAARRRELLDVAAGHGVLVLDDTAYADLWYEAPPGPPLAGLADGAGVITVGTFSKILATGVRTGWILAEPRWIEFFGRLRFDMGQSVLVHRMLAEFMAEGRLEPHIEAMRALYAEKARLLCDALEERAGGALRIERPRGGFYLWVELEPGRDALALWRAGAEQGVWFPTGHSFFAERRDPTGEHIRLAYAWPSKPDLVEGAHRIAEALAHLGNESSVQDRPR